MFYEHLTVLGEQKGYNMHIWQLYKGSVKTGNRGRDKNRCILMKFECVVLLSEETLRGGKDDVDLTSWAMV